VRRQLQGSEWGSKCSFKALSSVLIPSSERLFGKKRTRNAWSSVSPAKGSGERYCPIEHKV
jgi:hypothetical protein